MTDYPHTRITAEMLNAKVKNTMAELATPIDIPDFDQIARVLVDDAMEGRSYLANEFEQLISRHVTALRLVWNARGAADLKKLDAELSPVDAGTGTPGRIFSTATLRRAIRTLDR